MIQQKLLIGELALQHLIIRIIYLHFNHFMIIRVYRVLRAVQKNNFDMV